MKKYFGYKGVNFDLEKKVFFCQPRANNKKCRKNYFIGKEAKVKGELEVCKNGIHYCRKIKDVSLYYTLNFSIFYLKVEITGEKEHYGNKSVTKSLKPIEIIPTTEVLESLNLIKTSTEKKRISKNFFEGKRIIFNNPDDLVNIFEKMNKYKRTTVTIEKWDNGCRRFFLIS